MTAHTELRAMLGQHALHDETWRAIRTFERNATEIAEAIWNLRESTLWHIDRFTESGRSGVQQQEERFAEAVQRLWSSLGEHETTHGAATYLFHPQCWQTLHNDQEDQQHRRAALRRSALSAIAKRCLDRRMPDDWVVRVGRRVVDLIRTPNLTHISSYSSWGHPNETTNFGTCMTYLLDVAASNATAQIDALLDALTAGEWEAAWRAIKGIARCDQRPWYALTRIADVDHAILPMSDHDAAHRVRTLWQPRGSSMALALLGRLHEQQRLNMHIFRRMLEILPDTLHSVGSYLQNEAHVERNGTPALWTRWVQAAGFRDQLRSLYEHVVWEMVDGFEVETWPVLMRLNELRGGRYLLRLVEEVAHRGLSVVPAHPYSYWYERMGAAEVIGNLLSKLRRYDDNSASLVGLLEQIDVRALLAVLPHVRPFEDEICAALGWDGAVELVRLLHQFDQDDPARSTDPRVGVVERRAVEDVVARLGEEHTGIIMDAFQPLHPSATFLVKAVLGTNRTDVRRAFGRRRPLAARAMALLPFEKRDTVQKRYLELTTFYREANTSAAGKKAGERAAAQAGLMNLALHAGYADATRLEWAMHEELGEQGVAIGQRWEIEDYILTLVLRDGQPAIEVRNEQRVLKRTPAAVSRDYAYREVTRTRDLLKDQRRRYCEAFVNAMRRGEPLSEAELGLLARNPLAADLLSRLVLRDDAGAFGLFRAEDMTLEGYHEERVHVTSQVYIAHPYDLAQVGTLVDWQTEIVRRQLVQPFKQVFRELYLLTPAEITASVSSSRFAGRHLRGRQTMAVLANLGWVVNGGDINKPFYDLGYAAHFDIGYDWYDWNDDEGRSISGTLEFWPLKIEATDYRRRQEQRIKLADVPPRVLSEVLRDLDLVTVVAHHAEESGSSREVLGQRGDLVRATTAALGMENVVVEEPFVRVQGSRAAYRIHLATAAIHVESGAYLCIVPDGKKRKTTYLPWEDGGDQGSSELISKVLMLANDARIQDPTILAQLPQQRAA